MRDTERREELLAAEIAAGWLQRLRSGGPEVHAAFGRWLRESPRHVRELLFATAYQHAMGHMKIHRRVDLGSLREQCKLEARLSLPDSSLMGDSRSHARPRRKTGPGTAPWTLLGELTNWRLAAIAIFLVVASVTAVTIRAVSHPTLSTGPGEWQVERLVDGTVLRLGPRTTVGVRINDRERILNLERGELIAYVAKDASRPFLVQTPSVTARAVGTAFAVQQVDARHASITVREGLVAVRRTPAPVTGREAEDSPDTTFVLKAGETVDVTADDTPLRAQSVDLGRALAWVEGKLIFDNTVAEAIREMNRRNRTQVRLLDPAMSQRRLIGVFDAADPVSFAEALATALTASVVADGRDTLLLVPRIDKGSALSRARVEH